MLFANMSYGVDDKTVQTKQNKSILQWQKQHQQCKVFASSRHTDNVVQHRCKSIVYYTLKIACVAPKQHKATEIHAPHNFLCCTSKNVGLLTTISGVTWTSGNSCYTAVNA